MMSSILDSATAADNQPLQRIVLGVEYDGCNFNGWQSQRVGIRTVQSVLEAALSKVAAHPVRLVCAGRTDAGVHGLGQVVHFDSSALRSERAWLMGANSHLAADVNVRWVHFTTGDFHARFSAQRRRYCYLILNQAQRSALWRQRAAWYYRPLDAQLMQQAAQCFIGTHDFSALRAAQCQAQHPIRTIHSLQVRRYGSHILLDIEANAFLHHMVRNIAGVLIGIGSGAYPATWSLEVLQGRDRKLAGVTAPAHGLYLVAVRYPEHFGLDAVQKQQLGLLAELLGNL